MKIRIIGAIGVAVMVSAMLPAAAIAAPQVFIYTDKGSYQAGDTIEVSLAGENHGEGISVDVYIGLVTPQGSLYTLGELAWSQAIGPWIQDIYLPSLFNMERRPFFWFPLPCQMPPIHQPGDFAFMAGLMHSASFEFASAIIAAPFELVQVPRDYYVNAELGADANNGAEDAPWRTITHALDAVAATELAPATIHVAAGTYSTSTNDEAFPLNMKSFLSLVGEGADVTVLDAEGASNSVISCFEVDDSIIEGFTITGGNAHWGGGISCSGGSPVIRHNTITGNSARDGGGICCDGGRPIISDNVISDNSGYGGHGGGGVYCCYGYPTIQNNTIEGNWAYSQGGGISSESTTWAQIMGNTIRSNSAREGGGVGSYLGALSILGNSITDNSAGYAGGGIGCELGWPAISDNAISGNWAGLYGGGISLHWSSEKALVTNNHIVGNSTGGDGGGMISNYGGTILNNTIAENTAEGNGGGIFCEYGALMTTSNDTIAANVAGGLGGGIYACDEGREIIDSIIWNNGDDLHNCTATFCCVQDPDDGQANIHDDPTFVPGPYGDYYLGPDSPCIDAGSRSAEDAGLSEMTTRTDGTPDTGTVDMGVHYPVPSESLTRTSPEFQE